MKSVEKRIRQTMYACGQLMLDAHGADKEIAEKSGEANFVTKYDREIQRILRQQLGEIMPEAHFVGEEEETHEISFPNIPEFEKKNLFSGGEFVSIYFESLLPIIVFAVCIVLFVLSSLVGFNAG